MAVFLVALSILLIPLTILSYLPQCLRMITSQGTVGVSVWATLLLALSAQAQLPAMYYLFLCPPWKRYGEVIANPPLLQDYINLSQLLVQWVCSLVLLAVLLAMQSHPNDFSADDSAAASTAATKHARTAIGLLVGHAVLCVLWAWLAGPVPSKDWLDLPFMVIMSINNACINPFITLAIVAAFMLQLAETNAIQGSTALEGTTLLSQAIVLSTLAILWPFRFVLPENLIRGDDCWLVTEWYPLVGWPCINNFIIAIGQRLVIHAANVSEKHRRQLSGERQALLG